MGGIKSAIGQRLRNLHRGMLLLLCYLMNNKVYFIPKQLLVFENTRLLSEELEDIMKMLHHRTKILSYIKNILLLDFYLF
jgi:hypothetical protein